MTTEGVKIVIEADYKGGEKVRKSAEDMKSAGKAIRETGEKSKASTELVGTLANSFGQSQAGAFAGELAQITERLIAMNRAGETSKLMMAGMVAGAGVAAIAIGVKLGNAIADMIDKLSGFNSQVAQINRSFIELQNRAGAELGKRLGKELEAIEMNGDTTARVRELQEFADKQQAIMEKIAERRRVLANQINERVEANLGNPQAKAKRMVERMRAELAGLDSQMNALEASGEAVRRSIGAANRQGFLERSKAAEEMAKREDARKEKRDKIRASQRAKNADDARKQLKGVFDDIAGGLGVAVGMADNPLKKQATETFRPSALQNTENRFLQTGRSLEASPVKITADNTKTLVEDNKNIIDLLTGILEKPTEAATLEGV